MEADVTSSTKIDLSWDAPDEDRNDNNAAVTGYKIEAKKVTDSRYDTVVEDTKSTSTKYSHTDLDEDTSYIYRIYAINSEGESDPSSEIQAKTLSSDDDENIHTSQQNSSTSDNVSQQNSSTSDNVSQQNSSTSDNVSQQNSSTSDNVSQQNSSTSDNVSQQNSSTSDNVSQQNSSTSDNVSQQNSSTSDNVSQQNSSTSDNVSQQNSSTSDILSTNDVKNNSIEAFSNIIDPEKDPQYYVDRYNNESVYREWFDRNFAEITIYEALSMEQPSDDMVPELAAFVDPNQDPQYYVDRYNNEPKYKEWFDKNYSEYPSIYQAVGLDNPVDISDQNNDDFLKCGPGTELVEGICVILKTHEKPWWQFW